MLSNSEFLPAPKKKKKGRKSQIGNNWKNISVVLIVYSSNTVLELTLVSRIQIAYVTTATKVIRFMHHILDRNLRLENSTFKKWSAIHFFNSLILKTLNDKRQTMNILATIKLLYLRESSAHPFRGFVCPKNQVCIRIDGALDAHAKSETMISLSIGSL